MLDMFLKRPVYTSCWFANICEQLSTQASELQSVYTSVGVSTQGSGASSSADVEGLRKHTRRKAFAYYAVVYSYSCATIYCNEIFIPINCVITT